MKIRPKLCNNAFGEEGTCMFVWECIKTEGKHLGTCMDGFLFGSCCGHNESYNSLESINDSMNDFSMVDYTIHNEKTKNKPKPTATSTTTTTTTKRPTTTTIRPRTSTTTTTTTTTIRPRTSTMATVHTSTETNKYYPTRRPIITPRPWSFQQGTKK